MRQSIEVAGLDHGDMPIPVASRVGSLLVSSGLSGTDPATGTLAPAVDDQVAVLFDNIVRLMEAAGGTVGDIAKLTFFVRDRSCREAINKHWVDMFPAENSRPARHTLVYELAGDMQVQCEVIAFIK